MRLVMTLLVRDEQDILADHLDFHFSRGVDHVLAMDNRSRDRTPDILHAYARSGRLTYIHQGDDDYAQGVWVTGMARRAAREMGADWVINSDADEFWWPDHGDLKAVLAAVPPAFQGVWVERTNFLPPRDDPPRDHDGTVPFDEAMTVRETHSLNALGQPLPPKLCHRGLADVTVGQGNHDAALDGRPLTSTSAALSILHFPVRGYAQFSNKIANGGAAYNRNATLPPETGATWRTLYDRQRRGEFRASFDALVADDTAVAEGIAAGRLVRDTRLREALAALEADAS